MARNKVYTAHVRGRGSVDSDIVFIKDGFSWPAFFFTVLWALWHRLWLFALIVLASGFAVGMISELIDLDPLTDAVVGIAWAALVGYEANDARRRALASRDYDVEDIVLGQNMTQAEHRFFLKHQHLAPSPA
ncbi:MAG TPA: DUF2628 domain-containing protein [Alphaproteobacteria bacterium]|nr:DUF2628 domain-containing protein [Alphaproteobacteria bacterium]